MPRKSTRDAVRARRAAKETSSIGEANRLNRKAAAHAEQATKAHAKVKKEREAATKEKLAGRHRKQRDR